MDSPRASSLAGLKALYAVAPPFGPDTTVTSDTSQFRHSRGLPQAIQGTAPSQLAKTMCLDDHVTRR